MCNNHRPPVHKEPVATTVITSSPTCCVAREVKHILRLQERAEDRENCLSCGGSELGDNVVSDNVYNTRPFILYLQNGEPFSIRIADFFPTSESSNSQATNSSRSFIFRVESLNGTCATLRALKYCLGKYIATCFCCTIDLCECIAIQCLNDTFVSNLACTSG